MRTALVLLFLLAVAAVPGSLLPQRPLNPSKVSAYIAQHGGWGRLLDTFGMFDVFGSIWFAAIYLLLFVSLVGCLVPRIRVHARAMVRTPLKAPRHLAKLPESGEFAVSDAPDAYADRARAVLGRRWRVARRVEDSGAVTLSAEKGYSRETGNLLFHVALLAALILIAIGRLYTYEGTKILVQGRGFCNNVGDYDTWTPGRFAAEGKVSPAPLCIDDLTKFTATYTDTGEPREFTADLTYHLFGRSAGGGLVAQPEQRTSISVNHPLRVDGDRIYLTGHGYAPRVTVHMPNGSTQTLTAPFLPTDATTLYSQGVFKFSGPTPASGDDYQDVGISGFFAPTPRETSPGVYTSVSARPDHPLLGVFVYVGNLNYQGLPQSVYRLDTSKMTRIGAANLRVGDTKTFGDGVSVTFDGWVPFANLQVSHDPAQGYLLIAAVAMVLGLAASLGVRRRRVWLRIGPAAHDDGASPTVVQVGGLARSDSGNFTGEFAALLERLSAAGTPAPPVTAPASSADAIGVGRD